MLVGIGFIAVRAMNFRFGAWIGLIRAFDGDPLFVLAFFSKLVIFYKFRKSLPTQLLSIILLFLVFIHGKYFNQRDTENAQRAQSKFIVYYHLGIHCISVAIKSKVVIIMNTRFILIILFAFFYWNWK